MPDKRRVTILGGGAGGLATAFELTATPELREQYDVTVHQLGWRLGGKGASGRRAGAGDRIEEHGLHIWFGFYENAFDVIKRCYAELGREPGEPLATWRDAFHPCHDVVLLGQQADGSWRPRTWTFPERAGEPGPATEPGWREVLAAVIEWLRPRNQPTGADVPGAVETGFDALEEVLTTVAGEDEPGLDLSDVIDVGTRIAEALGFDEAAGSLGSIEDTLAAGLQRLSHLASAASDVAHIPGAVHDYATAFEVIAALIRGIADEDVLVHGFGILNDREFLDWLVEHGARRETVDNAPLLRAFYQLCFAYEDGDREQPCLAAGKAAQALLRIVATYRGAVMWKMQAGMGDAVFAPLYEVLRARGVRFRFFEQVTSLGVSADGAAIERVEIRPQARVSGEYRPLVDVEGLPCWPAEPHWDQLEDGAALRAAGINFELDERADTGVPAITLRRGEDFDDVVLAIPVGALGPLTLELAAHHQPWAEMLAAARTVATQALQLWLSADGSSIGWPARRETVCGAYVAPLDTYCDMTHLIPRERWGATPVRHIAYFCGVMDDRGLTQAQADARARADGLAHAREHLSTLWPGGCDGGGCFDFGLLADPEGRSGEERFEAQYWRANIAGTDRYVLTPPGSIEKRLRPDESGFRNLVLAGDWTRNGICGGSVEAAVTSGKLAARALGVPGDGRRVPGVDGLLTAD
jgi:uncharacterized protein with NAD-binding domain and iron-sulfur cluster